MRFVSRVLSILLLLSALAYGSYAFGKYVLSSRLLGRTPTGTQFVSTDSSHQEERVSRTSAVRGKPRVEVDVLPAEKTGDEPEPPSSPSTRRQPDEPGSRPVVTVDDVANPDGTSATPSSTDDANPIPEVKHRKHRRKHPKEEKKESDKPAAEATPADTSSSPDAPARRVSGEDSGSDSSDSHPSESRSSESHSSDSGSDSTPPRRQVERSEPDSGLAQPVPVDSSSPEPPKHRRHLRVRREVATPVKSDSTPTTTHVRRPVHRSEASPIPLPEGSGGGDSPVPLPE